MMMPMILPIDTVAMMAMPNIARMSGPLRPCSVSIWFIVLSKRLIHSRLRLAVVRDVGWELMLGEGEDAACVFFQRGRLERLTRQVVGELLFVGGGGPKLG